MWWWVLLLFVAMCIAGKPQCKITEFHCNNGPCISLDRFCDGNNDCQDKSDEPNLCSPCNRTYYGDVGRTYELEIHRPKEENLPFICHLNFTAAGGDLGDLIQLTFDAFTVGRFVSFTADGCPDGFMTIRERDRPETGGQWCGSAWGYTVYYSETSSLNLTLRLDRISQVGGYNFDFKLAYKFLRRMEANLRYGNQSMTSWRGDLMPESYCNRVLEGCDSRPCRIQSPNYPGVYPRNITCYYRIVQRQVPHGKHALLAVTQRNSHKIHIKDQVVKYDRSQRILRVWDQCNVVQDYLTVYDGGSTNDPVLVRLCGGDAIPDIISSSNNMLLEFHTSPFDNPFHPVPLSFLPGFELDVKVQLVEARSNQYVKDVHHCEVLMTSFDSTWGLLENPKHSLPPNTTCRYHLQGRRHEQVWISFLKYHAAPSDPATHQISSDCNARLRIWDGRISSLPTQNVNISLIGDFCKDEVPRLCDHTLLSNSSRFTRPCSRDESYTSSGSELTLEQTLVQGSVLYPLDFTLRYEFVDMHLEGAPTSDKNPCDRVFKSSNSSPRMGTFQSPRTVFYYGRGGSRNLSCLLKFESAPGERVQVTLTRAKFGTRKCTSEEDDRTGRWRCMRNDTGTAELWISEYPWPGVQLPRHCICSTIQKPILLTAVTSSVLDVNFTITLMNITQDYNDFYFEGEYQFIPASSDDYIEACNTFKSERRLRGSSGEIAFPTPTKKLESNLVTPEKKRANRNLPVSKLDCENHPWLIEPVDNINNFVYLKIQGIELLSSKRKNKSSDCPSRNRIVVYSGIDTRQPRIICPLEGYDKPRTVEIFSDGWNNSSSLSILNPSTRRIVVEYLEREPGTYMATWMEVFKRPLLTSTSSLVMSASSIDCPYRCPELNACISSGLWCDGERHCPSGYDEEESNCAFQFGVPVLYVAIGAGALLVLCLLIATTACFKCRQHQKRKNSRSPASNNIPQRMYPGSEFYLDGKEGLC